MKKDKFGIPIYNYTDAMEIIYRGETELLQNMLFDPNDQEVIKFNKLKLHKELEITISEFDQIMQEDLFLPEQYFDIDVKQLLLDRCTTQKEIIRVNEEYIRYKELNLINFLKWVIYFVDVCLEHNIIKGPGRGSSVSSYILYLLGLHNINSIKYDLDFNEFLRIGE